MARMSRARKTYIYTVTMSMYASKEIKAQYEREERFTVDSEHFITDVLYQDTSEARASAAFYRGVKKASGNGAVIENRLKRLRISSRIMFSICVAGVI